MDTNQAEHAQMKQPAPIDGNRGRPHFGHGRVLSSATEQRKTAPTPSLDPRNISNIEGIGGHEGYVQVAHDAFKAAHDSIAAAITARDKVWANTAWTEEQKLIELAGYVEKRQEAATRAMDRAHQTLQSQIKSLTGSLTRPLETAADNSISREIREHVKQLTSEQRHKFIAAAIDNGDARTCNAVLGTVPYLSGLYAEAQRTYTRMWHERMNPEVSARVRVMERAFEIVGQRGSLVVTEFEAVLGGRGSWVRVSAARERMKAARDALSL